MFGSLKRKLLASYLLLIVLSLLIVGGYLLHALETRSLRVLEDRLKAQSILVVEIFADLLEKGDAGVDSQDLALLLAAKTEARVTLLDKNGKVLGDSLGKVEEMENHLDRPEIESVVKGGSLGCSRRYSATLKAEMLYIAFPVSIDSRLEGIVRLALPLTDIRREVRSQWSFLLTATLLAGVVSLLVSFRLSSRIAAPLQQITQTARRIAAGDFRERVMHLPDDEVGRLGEALNDMAGSMAEKINEIEEGKNRLETVLENIPGAILLLDKYKNILLVNTAVEKLLGLERRLLIGQRLEKAARHNAVNQEVESLLTKASKRIQREIVFPYPSKQIMEMSGAPVIDGKGEITALVIAFRDITERRKLEQLRKDFITNITHEIRTPVTSLQGFAETLLDGALEDKETAREFVEIMNREAGRLASLISELLELSRMEHDQALFDIKSFDLLPVMAENLNSMEQRAKKEGIELKSVLSPEPIFVLGDKDKVRQVLQNLLDNALKYNLPGCQVTLAAEISKAENAAVVRVTDDGPGIPPAEISRIFERFYRVEKGRSRKQGGFGLGLAIVKHIIEGHGGRIWVENNQSKGVSFFFTLPLAKDAG